MAKGTKRRGKYANSKKSGSKSPKNYDPKTSSGSGGSGTKLSKMYSPAGKGPQKPPGSK